MISIDNIFKYYNLEFEILISWEVSFVWEPLAAGLPLLKKRSKTTDGFEQMADASQTRKMKSVKIPRKLYIIMGNLRFCEAKWRRKMTSNLLGAPIIL